jgi:hypothetical protein
LTGFKENVEQLRLELPVIRSNPNFPRLIFQHGGYRVVADAVRILRVMMAGFSF